MGLRGSGRLVGVKNWEVSGCVRFFEIMKFFGRLSFLGEASGCGRLVGVGG